MGNSERIESFLMRCLSAEVGVGGRGVGRTASGSSFISGGEAESSGFALRLDGEVRLALNLLGGMGAASERGAGDREDVESARARFVVELRVEIAMFPIKRQDVLKGRRRDEKIGVLKASLKR